MHCISLTELIKVILFCEFCQEHVRFGVSCEVYPLHLGAFYPCGVSCLFRGGVNLPSYSCNIHFVAVFGYFYVMYEYMFWVLHVQVYAESSGET